MKKLLAAGIIWIVCGVISAGFINASNRGDYIEDYKDSTWAKHQCAMTYGISITFGLIALSMSPFTTGFYQHGYHATCEPIK